MDGYMNFIVYTNRNSFVNMSEHFKMNKVIKLKHSRLPRPHTIKTGAIGFSWPAGLNMSCLKAVERSYIMQTCV